MSDWKEDIEQEREELELEPVLEEVSGRSLRAVTRSSFKALGKEIVQLRNLNEELDAVMAEVSTAADSITGPIEAGEKKQA